MQTDNLVREQNNITVELTGRRATENLRRITLDAKHAPAAPVQRFVRRNTAPSVM